jgi:hypothetical protein
MKAILLDFDGTIAPLSLHHTSNGFSATACANVQSILTKDPNARIVVSSAWRRWGLEKVREILKENGIDPTKVIGVTEAEGGWTPENRAKQINNWLKNHKEVKEFVVLDDSPMPEFGDRFIKVNPYVGFTEKDAENALKALNANP